MRTVWEPQLGTSLNRSRIEFRKRREEGGGGFKFQKTDNQATQGRGGGWV